MTGPAGEIKTKSVQSRVFELIGGHPALDLVNTLDWRFRDSGPEELLENYPDLLRFTEQSALLSTAQSRRISRAASQSDAARVLGKTRELREALAETFYAMLDGRRSSTAALGVLEVFFRNAARHQTLSASGERFNWEWVRPSESSELPLWVLSCSAEKLITSEGMQRVRACGNPGCRWLFLDTSKNHTRRWCDMKICGNRMKARRFKAQHRI